MVAAPVDYFDELTYNHERVERFNVAKKYKGRAMVYLCEALSLYLTWKTENPRQGEYSISSRAQAKTLMKNSQSQI
jgi:hypothetical protein